MLDEASYYPFGPVAQWTFGNGRQLLRPLNQNYQPAAIVDGASGGLSLVYSFDPVGNLTQLEDGDQSTILARYGYDALNRLSDVMDGPTGTVIEHYAYDATGNRKSVTNAGVTTAYTYPSTSHRLTKVGSITRSYDAAGNTTAIGGTARQFVYDGSGRLSSAKRNGAVVMNYVYNGRGEQVRKYLGTTSIYTVYDEAGHWLGDYDNTGAAIQQAIWMDDLPVGLLVGATSSQTLAYLEPDALGTPRVVIDPKRDVSVWEWSITGEAFSATLPNEDPDGDGNLFGFGMRFPGQRYNWETGWNYNYARDYDSSVGRYTKSDPVGLRAGPNTYAYGNDSPTQTIDVFGLAGGSFTYTYGPTPGGYFSNGWYRTARPPGPQSVVDTTNYFRNPRPSDPNTPFDPSGNSLTGLQVACYQSGIIADICGPGPFMKWGCAHWTCGWPVDGLQCGSDRGRKPIMTGPDWKPENDPSCRCEYNGWIN